MLRVLVCALALFGALPQAHAQDARPHVVLVTIDGLRWQDLFRGADPDLVTDPAYRARFIDPPDRAQALAPFLLSFAEQGALIGNRDQNSCARVANEFWFSYPGYAEILAGRPNPEARSNQSKPNADVTVLERLAGLPEFAGQIRVFAEWDVVPYILNVERSGLSVFTPSDNSAPHDPQIRVAAREVFGALPRVTWIAFGDTDNRAHEGDYHAYLAAAVEADEFLRQLWQAIEADPATAGATTLIVTTDHGRGEAARGRWRGHGSGHWRRVVVPGLRHEGSDATFFAVRGPGIVSTDVYNLENCATAGQTAATMLKALGLHAEMAQPDMAPPLAIFDNAASDPTTR